MDLIRAGTVTLAKKPRDQDIIDFIDESDIEVLCGDFLKALETASATLLHDLHSLGNSDCYSIELYDQKTPCV